MTSPLRKLNDQGIYHFRQYLLSGAGPVPVDLLTNPETSEPFPHEIFPIRMNFANRFEFGRYLNDLLDPLDATAISRDKGLWTALAVTWFDLICPPNSTGQRKPDKEYRYILSSDYRHYYRHLIRSPWQLVRRHGELARFLLIAPTEHQHPLSVHGEILEQFGGRQQVLASQPIVAAASKLYFDDDKGRPRRGAAGAGRGSARRFGIVLRQFELTYDPACMTEQHLIGLLPTEFNRWKSGTGS